MKKAVILGTVASLLLTLSPPARSYFLQGEPTESTSEIDSLLNRAYERLEAGELERAREEFLKVLEADPQNQRATLELGYLAGRQSLWAEAVRWFEKAIGREPENLRLRLELGYALQGLGELERAENEFQAVAREPGEFQAQAQEALAAVARLMEEQRNRREKARDERRDALLNRGYAALEEGRREEARELFEQALALDAEHIPTLKQLGYLALSEESSLLAAKHFQQVLRLDPQDYETALQLGFIYDEIRDPDKAEDAFAQAMASPDEETRSAATQALRNVRASRPRKFYVDFYSSPLYIAGTRFSNFIGFYQVRAMWRPAPEGPWGFYLGHRLTRDTESAGGTLPQILSDNFALFGPGIEFHPRGWNTRLSAEANVAVNLVRVPGATETARSDFRIELSHFRRWEAKFRGLAGLAALGRARNERFFTDLDASLGYYSRFEDNVIGYLQLREGVRLGQWGPVSLFGYWKLSLAKDTNRDFFNNVGEGGGGLEIKLLRKLGISLRGEFLRGVYYGIEGRDPNSFGPNYNDVRILVVFGRRF